MTEQDTPQRGKNGKEERLRWHHLILLHRECVRRNPDYATHYRQFQTVPSANRAAWALTLEEHWGLWICGELPDPEDRPNLQQLLQTPPSATALRRYDEWDDPLETIAEEQLRQVLPLSLETETLESLKGFAVFLYIPEEPGSDLRYAALDMRRSQKELQGFLEDLLHEVLASRKQHHLKPIPPPKRLRVEEMFKYLRAYDLRQEKWAYDHITRTLWPGQDKEKAGWEYVKKAKQLIRNPPLFSLFKEYLGKRIQGRCLSLEDLNPPIVVPKTRARLRGRTYEGQQRWRLGPLLVRAYPRDSSADHSKSDRDRNQHKSR